MAFQSNSMTKVDIIGAGIVGGAIEYWFADAHELRDESYLRQPDFDICEALGED